MRDNNKIVRTLILVGSTIGILVVVSILLSKFYASITRKKALAEMNRPEAKEEFKKVIGTVDDLNNGISLISRKSFWQDAGQSRLNYDIWVTNNTDESITFPNEGFGVHVFAYDNAKDLWKELELSIWPSTTSKIISPNSKVNEDYNYWILNSHLFKGVELNHPIRVFVSGVGSSSCKRYGAYQDIWLDR